MTAPGDTQSELQSLAQFPDEDPNPVLRVSGEGTILYANRSSWVLLVHWQAQVGGTVPEEWVQTIHEALARRDVIEREVAIGFKTILLVIVPIVEKGYINLYGLDMTRRRQVEDKLRLNAQVFESVAEGIMIMDTERRILDVNRAFCAITGRAREDVLGEPATVLTEEGEKERVTREMWASVARQGTWQGEVWDRRRGGEPYPQWLSLSAIHGAGGEVTGYIALFSDITAMKEAEQRLYRMAHYDSLTGLCNRRHFLDLLERAMKNARRTGEVLALMFIDLDSFKLVNDDLGHAAGDILLAEVAVRLRASVRESDTVARMGGDEFTVLLPNLQGPENAGAIARKILTGVAGAMELEGREVFVTASIGIAVYPQDAHDAAGLLRNADTAMYHAKERGRNGVRSYAREMSRSAAERLVLKTRIRHALEQNEFVVHYQPQVDIRTGRLTGLEALVRWDSPERGLLPPEAFIEVAEQSGQICDIGAHVLRSVCRQGTRWLSRGLPPVSLGVNVSMHQLWRVDFVSQVEAVLAESGFPPERLELELTEGILIPDNRDTLRKLESLRSIGVTLAIDDFGTKYSSFGYLRRLPINRLKIDSSFVQELRGDGAGREITAAIIAIGRSLKIDVIAEGVETAAQLEALRELGCSCAQGYFFSRPGTPEAAEAHLIRGTITPGGVPGGRAA